MRKSNGFRWKALSQRQKQVLSWWTPQSTYSGYNGIIADGAIRSGKTFAMSFSFVQWAMTCYSGRQFAMCGKTIASFRRNVMGTLKQQLAARGYNVKEHRAEKLHDRQQERQNQRVLLFRRQGREQPGSDPGHHPCRGILRRGGPDAAELRQSGHSPMLCHRVKVLV